MDGTIGAGFACLGMDLEGMGIRIELRADGWHDGGVAFALPAALGIVPAIRARVNSGARAKGVNRVLPRAVPEHLAEGAAARAWNQTA